MVVRKEQVDKIYEQLVNKMLEKHNIDWDFVIKNPIIEETPWYDHYTWSSEEQDQFKEWAVDFLRKNYKMPKYKAEGEVSLFILYCGLKTTGDDT